MEKTKELLKILIIPFLFCSVIFIFADLTCPINVYADEVPLLYDAVPVFADGSEGTVVHSEKIQFGSSGGGLTPGFGGGGPTIGFDSGGLTPGFGPGSGLDSSSTTIHLVKLPEGTVAVKFYGSNTTEFWQSSDDPTNPKGKSFSVQEYADNSWWKINISEFKDNPVNVNGNWYSSFKDSNYYVKEADYYELVNNTSESEHFFIQIGDANNPLDVFAYNTSAQGTAASIPKTSFAADKTIDLKLTKGKRKNDYGYESNSQEIWFTTDGTDPSSSESAKKYTEIIKITRSCTVQAATKVSDDKWGTVALIKCTINAPSPEFTPVEGSYSGSLDVTISCGLKTAKLYYTLDGTDPLDSSGNLISSDNLKQYTGPFMINNDTTVKAVAVAEELTSVVVTAAYKFSTGIAVDFADDDQGVWISESTLHTDKEATIVTKNDRSKCRVLVTTAEGATIKLNNEPISAETNGENRGKYLLDLNVKQNAEFNEFGDENIISITNGDKTDDYKIYCIASLFPDVPDKVVDYFVPASQYTNNGIYGTAPNRTLIGKPRFSMGSSLGNFGGYITWYYEKGIKNDPKNPYGVDFIVIGNSFDGTNEAAEPGNIMVSEDGKKWFTLAGSIHYDNNVVWNQEVTYTDDQGLAKYSFKDLSNNIRAGLFTMPAGTARFLYPKKAYYPLHSGDDYTTFTTTGTFLIPEPGVNVYGNGRPPYPAFGYADVGYSSNCDNEIDESGNPYNGLFRDTDYPDRVKTNRNGDACDIAWAVDENGAPANLNEIHYIKVQNASFIDNGAIGEKSTEVNVMRIAKAASAPVGKTAAPKSIKIDGQEVALTADEVVNFNVTGIFDIVVDAPEDANVYINSLRSHTAFMKEAPHGIVRVIVQEGEKEPQIYYYKITQDPQPESKTVTAVTFWTRNGNKNTSALNGLLHDKDSLTCYFDEDTVEHFGGEVRFSEATSAKESKGFVCWKDSEGKVYSAFNAAMAESGTDLALTATYADKDDAEKVKAAVALIADLPSSDKVTLEDNEAILKAKKAYDELTDEQKGFVAESDSNKLTADQNAIIKIVEDKIDALPEADAVKTTDAEAVIAAGVAFDSLADTQKALVDQAKAVKLAAVRLALFDAFAAAIPDEVTEEQEDALAAAQAVYDSLPNDLKVQAAANYIKLVEAKLSVAMEKLEKANQQIADKQSEIDKLTNETIPALTQQLNDKIAELKTAKEEEIPALQAEIAELEQKLEKAGSDLADANAEIEELRKELVDNSIKDLIESAEKTIAAIQKDLKEAGDSISTKAIKALVETADQILDAAKTKAEEASAALAENAKEIASLRDQVAKASADLAKAGEELAKAVASGKASEAEITGLKDRLAEAEAAKAEAEKAAQEALAGKQTSDEALKAAQKALKETQDELEKTAAELAALQAKIAASKFKVKGLTVTSKSSKFTVTWTKFDGADGYKVQYRKKGAKKYKNLKELTKNKVVSKKLKKGKAYQFRVRTYKMVGEKKVYGKWAKSKAVKCK